jgi:hypothetical protein
MRILHAPESYICQCREQQQTIVAALYQAHKLPHVSQQ